MRKMIPNLVTMTGMGCGFFAILVAHRGAVDAALLLVLGSVTCDILDGKLARLLRVSSRFGAELDSFSDAIAFGVAPAVILFDASLHRLGWLGAAAAFIFVAMSVFRLVRFNLDASEHDRRDFFPGFLHTRRGPLPHELHRHARPAAGVGRRRLCHRSGVFYGLFTSCPLVQRSGAVACISRRRSAEHADTLPQPQRLDFRLVEPLRPLRLDSRLQEPSG